MINKSGQKLIKKETEDYISRDIEEDQINAISDIGHSYSYSSYSQNDDQKSNIKNLNSDLQNLLIEYQDVIITDKYLQKKLIKIEQFFSQIESNETYSESTKINLDDISDYIEQLLKEDQIIENSYIVKNNENNSIKYSELKDKLRKIKEEYLEVS